MMQGTMGDEAYGPEIRRMPLAKAMIRVAQLHLR